MVKNSFGEIFLMKDRFYVGKNWYVLKTCWSVNIFFFFGENFVFVDKKNMFFLKKKTIFIVEVFFVVVGENMLFCEKKIFVETIFNFFYFLLFLGENVFLVKMCHSIIPCIHNSILYYIIFYLSFIPSLHKSFILHASFHHSIITSFNHSNIPSFDSLPIPRAS